MTSEEGHQIVFVVQHVSSKKEGWRNSGEACGFISNIPAIERHIHDDNGRYTGLTPVFREFSTAGEVYKNHVFHGSYNKKDAEHFMRVMAQYNTDFVFRVVKITIVLVTEQVAMANYC